MTIPKPERTERNFSAVATSCHGLGWLLVDRPVGLFVPGRGDRGHTGCKHPL